MGDQSFDFEQDSDMEDDISINMWDLGDSNLDTIQEEIAGIASNQPAEVTGTVMEDNSMDEINCEDETNYGDEINYEDESTEGQAQEDMDLWGPPPIGIWTASKYPSPISIPDTPIPDQHQPSPTPSASWRQTHRIITSSPPSPSTPPRHQLQPRPSPDPPSPRPST